MNGEKHAHAILVMTRHGERWFVRFGAHDQVQTAWSLAGAELFLPESDKLMLVETALDARGRRWRRMLVHV